MQDMNMHDVKPKHVYMASASVCYTYVNQCDCQSHLGNANPGEGDIFQTRVYGFGGIQTRVPRYPGLM